MFSMIRILRTSFAGVVFLMGFGVCKAQTLAVQVPFGSAAAGIAPSTYNGTTANGSVCTGYLDTSGDGCPATQATLTSPVGLTVDSLNNAYIAQLSVYAPSIRVLYQGGSALSSALQNANPTLTFTPTAGYMYGLNASSSTLTSHSGVYYCTGSSGAVALDSTGDGCPAAYAKWQALGVQVDAGGNIFMVTSNSPTSGVKVIYVGGGTTAQNTAAVNLIKSYNPTVSAPCSGCIYSLSAYTTTTSTDFEGAYDIAIDSNENLYVADKGTYTTGQTGVLAATSGSQIKKYVSSPTAGWVTYIPEGAANPTGADGDGGAAGSATVSTPRYLMFDANNNLYIADSGNNRVRVVYSGGNTPPLYINNGTTPTSVSTPTVGSIYTVAAGQANGASRNPGIAASLLYIPAPQFGLDRAGNLYVDNAVYFSTFAINSATGVVTLLGGSGASTTTGSANTTPGAGAYCNNGTRGPKMTDAYSDGCPATQIDGLGVVGRIGFDSLGNMYELEEHTVGNPVGLLRKYSYAGQYGTVGVGNSATQTLAFMPIGTGSVYTSTPVLGLVSSGNSTSEFTDAGNDVCTTTTADQTCIYNVTFSPALAGVRQGGLALTYSGATVVSAPLGGVGSGAQISLDPATETTVGTGLSPTGVGVDQSGNFYIADGTSNSLFKSTSGGTPVSFATGFSTPKQVAVSGTGTVYVADSGNNRIAAVTQAGAVSTFAVSNNLASYTLSGPSGVAVDGSGNVYIADTGNNRVLEVTGGSTLESNVVTVLGFTGLNSPRGITVDAAGDLFVADSGNARVVELSAAGVQTAVTVSPSLTSPVGVSVDPAGDLFIADASAASVVLLPHGSTTATTLLGSTTGLTGIATDNTGNLAVSASTATGILLLNRTQTLNNFAALAAAGATSSQALTIRSAGNTSLLVGTSLDSSTDTTNFAVSSASTNGCSTGATLTIGQYCALSILFQPQTASNFIDTVTFPTWNAVNTAKALFSGSVLQLQAQTISFSRPTSPVNYASQQIALSATASSGLPVTFTVLSGPGSVSGTYGATLTVTGIGTIVIAANQSGNTTYLPASQVTQSIVVVVSGNVWIANSNGTLSEFSNAGSAISPGSGYTGGGSGIAVGLSGTIWSGISGGTSIDSFSTTGTVTGTYSGAGLSSPVATAIDGSGSLWIVNSGGTLSELNSSGNAISPSTGFSGIGLSTPVAIAIDGSGNVWVANSGDSSITEFLGAAQPAITPLASAVQNGTQGTKP